MHQSVIVWWWMQTELNGYGLLILCTMYCDNDRLMSGKFLLQAVHHSSGDWSVCHVQMKNVYAAGWWSCAVGTSLLPHWLKTILGLLTVLCDKGRSKHGAAEPAAWICGSRQWGCLPAHCQNGSDKSFVGQEPAQNGQAGCKALEE